MLSNRSWSIYKNEHLIKKKCKKIVLLIFLIKWSILRWNVPSNLTKVIYFKLLEFLKDELLRKSFAPYNSLFLRVRLRRSLFTDRAEWSNIWLNHTSSGPFYLFYFWYVRHPRNVPLSRFIFKFIYGERLSLYATDHRARRPVISYLSFLLSN